VGDGARTRDIPLGRKDATARAVRVFKKALDASMAHFLEPLLLSLNPPCAWLDAAQDAPHQEPMADTTQPRTSRRSEQAATPPNTGVGACR
jgi:hypothetical protein